MLQNYPGKFITFEGGEGSGKSTIAQYVVEELVKLGYPAVFTREPGGIPAAEEIRKVLLNPEFKLNIPEAEALLFAASRIIHIKKKVLPALKEGKIVVSDRYIHSSYAYQGYARGLGEEWITQINKYAIEQAMPTITIYLNVPPEVGLARVSKNQNSKKIDRLDSESLSFHNKVREAYLKMAQKEKDKFIIIDATKPEEEVKKEALKVILDKLGFK